MSTVLRPMSSYRMLSKKKSLVEDCVTILHGQLVLSRVSRVSLHPESYQSVRLLDLGLV